MHCDDAAATVTAAPAVDPMTEVGSILYTYSTQRGLITRASCCAGNGREGGHVETILIGLECLSSTPTEERVTVLKNGGCMRSFEVRTPRWCSVFLTFWWVVIVFNILLVILGGSFLFLLFFFFLFGPFFLFFLPASATIMAINYYRVR